MTLLAILEIEIAAEGAPSVMAGCAGVISGWEVFQSTRRTYLSSLR
jgi:hypothetical protein